MSYWRIALVAALVAVPFLLLTALGSYYLWREDLWVWVWWPLALCMAAGYFLGLHWQRQKKLLASLDFTPPLHWTDRDRAAWQLVVKRAEAAAAIPLDRFTEFDFYTQTAHEMALDLARFYHPGAEDPFGPLTLPEILAAAEYAAHDLRELVDQYVPGSHLLTINNLRQAQQAADWYTSASNVYWVVSAVLSPINTGLRFVASHLGMTRPWQQLQQNLLLWFYTAYLQRIGSYLIDLNSGRMRLGAERYRELLRQRGASVPSDGAAAPRAAADDDVRRVTVTLFGQVKAGKSSLVNGLLGEQRAQADVLPATAELTRYELQPPGVPTRLVLLDTVGYAHTGPKADQLRVTQESAQQSDLLLLVLHARNPARQPDLKMLQALRGWFAGRPDLKMPPVLAVLTHIDLLSPAMEWSPPYDWQHPMRVKEHQMAEAVAAAREQLCEYLRGVVPVCVAPGKVHGVEEWLLPAVSELLDEGHAVGLLRCIRAEIDAGKVRRVWEQFRRAAREAAHLVWQNLPARGERSTPAS